jgi:hypothetical protein
MLGGIAITVIHFNTTPKVPSNRLLIVPQIYLKKWETTKGEIL